MVCEDEGTDIHEIVRGAHREAAYQDRCTWLRLCRECHEQMGDLEIWPIAMQYSLKMYGDPKYYDRIQCNRLRGRADNAIDEKDVAATVRTLFLKLELVL